MTFADHFSATAPDYRRFRPGYPAELYAWLATLTPGRALAWDCATGNGQAARGLRTHFDRVVATDASAEQIAGAREDHAVEYRVAPASASGLAEASVDLVAVAQALHWFADDAFYTEVRRVLRDGGVLATWGYGLIRVDDGVDPIVERFYGEVLGAYWPRRRVHVENAYRDLLFPFDEVADPPSFTIRASLSAADLIGYLGTWSAVKRCRELTGRDPVKALVAEIEGVWGEGAKTVGWPLFVRAGR